MTILIVLVHQGSRGAAWNHEQAERLSQGKELKTSENKINKIKLPKSSLAAATAAGEGGGE